MTMKFLKCCALAAAIVATWQVAALADGGRPSRAILDAMGLSDMQVMSDEAALSVRGFGFGSHAAAWGRSFAVVSGHGASAASKNGYDAFGKHKAQGENLSFAEIQVTHSRGGKRPIKHGGSKGGMKTPNYGGYGGTGKGGGHKGGGKPTVKAVRAFAGGGSFAKAK